MTLSVFKYTIITNIRNIVFWLALTASALFIAEQILQASIALPHRLHVILASPVGYLASNVIPLLLGIIASVDILRDRKNRFFDIERASGISIFKYYSAKLSAYMLLGFCTLLALSFLYLFVYCLRTDWLAVYTDYTVAESFWLIFVRVVFYGFNSIPFYTAVAVCVSILTLSSTAGIIASVIVAFSNFFIQYAMTYFGNFIYPVADNIYTFFGYYKAHAPAQAVVHIPAADVVISYTWGFAITAALLTIGYLRLRKLNDK